MEMAGMYVFKTYFHKTLQKQQQTTPFSRKQFLHYILIQFRKESVYLSKSCVCYFLFFHQMKTFQKLWKKLFISSEKLFRSQDIQTFAIFSLPLHTFQIQRTSETEITYCHKLAWEQMLTSSRFLLFFIVLSVKRN